MLKVSDYIAHVKQDMDGSWDTHPLEQHLYEVAGLAEKFAKSFESKDWAYLAGLWHDLGKYRPAFQDHIRKSSGYEPDAHISSEKKSDTSHASTGAVHAIEKLGSIGKILAYVIAGHHAGLPDFEKVDAKGRSLREIISRDKELLQQAIKEEIPEKILKRESPPLPPFVTSDPGKLHTWIRMLFSCLVDADFLDTERFMSPEKAGDRVQDTSMKEMLCHFDEYMKQFQKKQHEGSINSIRAKILKICRVKAIRKPGIYTMTVPTGGGKTLSSLAFALEHAVRYDKQRIVYAIPYTSIIEQTAEVFRGVFEPLGDVLIEHHSNTEPDKYEKETSWSRLAVENWDAPLIVTTTVQLFESLYASRTSRCRKLHNLVNSVIVIDETQLLPPEQLNPIRHIVQSLNQHYGVTFVMSTATPTGFEAQTSPFGKRLLEGIESDEIIDAPKQYYRQLERVNFKLPDDFSQKQSWDEISSELKKCDSVLAIVNTRKDARELWEKMPEGTFHLSALMCAQHRSEAIQEIKNRLKHGQSTRVISTQLVEAGVDLDFPVVYRALAGLDSIVQAAGRCNREGKLDKGKVVVFVPPYEPPRGLLTQARDTSVSLLHGFHGDIQSPETFERYFNKFYAEVKDHDKNHVLDKLQKTADELQIQFRTAAQQFKMIDDNDTVSVIVRHGDNDGLLNVLAKGEPDRRLLRKLQRYTVTLYKHQFEKMLGREEIKEIYQGFYAQSESGIYHSSLGLLLEPELTAAYVI
ncbi:MAG: CRISPR-associated helicase Cas3' [Gammaproteobacteria bacterium]|nr:CRISPR-associated helicase Cas3' [Gammaproteobacteria bacterium]